MLPNLLVFVFGYHCSAALPLDYNAVPCKYTFPFNIFNQFVVYI